MLRMWILLCLGLYISAIAIAMIPYARITELEATVWNQAADMEILKATVVKLQAASETQSALLKQLIGPDDQKGGSGNSHSERSMSSVGISHRKLFSFEDNDTRTQINERSIIVNTLEVKHILNITGNIIWQGLPVGFDVPSQSPTPAPTPYPTLQPTLQPTAAFCPSSSNISPQGTCTLLQADQNSGWCGGAATNCQVLHDGSMSWGPSTACHIFGEPARIFAYTWSTKKVVTSVNVYQYNLGYEHGDFDLQYLAKDGVTWVTKLSVVSVPSTGISSHIFTPAVATKGIRFYGRYTGDVYRMEEFQVMGCAR